MAERIVAKNRWKKEANFNALQEENFQVIAIVASSTTATPRTSILLPFACKVPLVTIMADTASPGVTAFNIALANGAEVGGIVADNSDTKQPPTLNTTSGITLFENAALTAPSDQAVTLVAYVPQTFQSTEPDAIFPRNTVLTLRYASGATVNGNLFVTLGFVAVDIYPTHPEYTAFNWLNDIG
jgi:hypothetical protein